MQLLSQWGVYSATVTPHNRLGATSRLAGGPMTTLTLVARVILDVSLAATVYYLNPNIVAALTKLLQVNDTLTDQGAQVSYSPGQSGSTKYTKSQFDALLSSAAIPGYVTKQDF